ncbi:MAG: preprotein translocase subunit SecG [Halothiobacillus sp.]|nr:preprotein translocase subunit SecG [Halothiobacillus sp.]
MQTLILIGHVLIGLTLIGLVLIQHGKGADAGAAFGSGSSGTVFGARGAATFLQKMTGWLVVAFFATSLLLAYVINTSHSPSSVVNSVPVSKTDSGDGSKRNPQNSVPSPSGSVTPAPVSQGKPSDVPSTSVGSDQVAPAANGSTQPADVPIK